MKASPSLKVALLLLLSFIFSHSFAQSQQYYVVIGAFAKESNAIKFSGFSRSRFFQATYELNPVRKLFYVYVIKTTDKKAAFNQVRILQKEEAFRDSWVFKGTLGNEIVPEVPPVVVKPEDPPADTVMVEPEPEPEPEKPVVQDTVVVVTQPEPTQPPARIVRGKLFNFAIKTSTGEPITGSVHHVDLTRGRDLGSYKGNEESDVLKPADQSEPMTFVCGIFGYKEITQLIDYNDPSQTEGAVKDEHGVWTIPFTLERLKKGDVTVMYDVSFYKDAVIMLPRSQEELDELVNLMNLNPAYKIKVHGHTNGNNKRKIIALGKTRNYFNMKGSDQRNGTAKELSRQRAEAVRDYLVEHGIEKSRMEIMAWGGLNMLVGEGSASSKLNDRIEIEILEDKVK